MHYIAVNNFVKMWVNVMQSQYNFMYIFPMMFSCVVSLFRTFPFSRGEAGQLSFRYTATFVMFSIAPCCWPFLSTFLPPLLFLDLCSDNIPIVGVVFLAFCNLVVSFLIYSHRRRRLPRVLQPPCFVSYIFPS